MTEAVHAELRFKVLLAWAVEFVERETDCLEECHRWPDGTVREEDAAAQIADARRWLGEAKEMLG